MRKSTSSSRRRTCTPKAFRRSRRSASLLPSRAYSLIRSGIDVGSLIVNRVLPDGLEGEFYVARRRQEAVYRREIDERFAALDRIVISQLESDVYGVAKLERISAQIFG